MVMRPVFAAAKSRPGRVAYAEGEEERVLRAVQVVLDEGLARPILIGRPAVMQMRIERAGLRMRLGDDFEVVNPDDDPRYRAYWEDYQHLMGREGVTPEMAKAAMRRSNTLIGSMMLRRGDADAMLTGLVGRFDHHLEHIANVIGLRKGAHGFAAMNGLMLGDRTLFLTDTFVNEEPDAQALAEIAMMAVEEVRRFGLPPKVAFLSHSNFGSSTRPAARRMREAARIFRELAPDVECDGEMHGDAALSDDIRRRYLPQHDAERRGQPARAAEHRCREHPLQRAEDDRRPRHHDRARAARSGPARAHPDAVGDGAAGREHDRAVGGRRGRHGAHRVCCGLSGD